VGHIGEAVFADVARLQDAQPHFDTETILVQRL